MSKKSVFPSAQAGAETAPTADCAFPVATTTEDDGVRFLHLGTPWVQGAMRLRKPDAIELEYVRMMMMWLLFKDKPRHVAQLGLGSAALTKFCHRYLPETRVTAIELNPNVIAVCRAQFALPADDERLQVRQMNALDFVLDPANHGTLDILQVDLYDEEARGPVLDTPEFYQACADCLTADGMLTINVFGDFANYDKNFLAIEQAFDALAWLPEVHDANVVGIAFKQAPQVDFEVLFARAAAIKSSLNLPARAWVIGLKKWMRDQQ